MSFQQQLLTYLGNANYHLSQNLYNPYIGQISNVINICNTYERVMDLYRYLKKYSNVMNLFQLLIEL